MLKEHSFKSLKNSPAKIRPENISSSIEDHPYLTRLSKILFVLCIFFVLYGTSIPFQARAGGGVEDMVESNVTNQIVFTGLFFLSLLTIIPKAKTIYSFLKEEKIFSIFILWCAATILWSDESSVSFKRFFQFITIILVIISAIAYTDDADELIDIFKYLLVPYVIISLITIAIIPRAIDQWGSFKGIAPSKNNFGQYILISILFFSHLFFKGGSREKLFYLILLVFSTLLIFGSRSATAVITFVVVFMLNIILFINKEFEAIGFRKFFFAIVMIFFVALASLAIVYSSEIINSFFGGMGKDLTLTGRTDIWASVLENARSHIVQGCGYQSFWISVNPFIEEFYETYYWIPLQSHSGYIDILNELGIIGLGLFVFWTVKFFKTALSLTDVSLLIWIFITALILNITESTIIRARNPTGVMMIFSYLVLQKKYFVAKYGFSR